MNGPAKKIWPSSSSMPHFPYREQRPLRVTACSSSCLSGTRCAAIRASSKSFNHSLLKNDVEAAVSTADLQATRLPLQKMSPR
jgi:hypothetical protein